MKKREFLNILKESRGDKPMKLKLNFNKRRKPKVDELGKDLELNNPPNNNQLFEIIRDVASQL
tara:strand:+ start:2928 stop:3116 length:189 start_codon:yes stop_codon:yes gene_type:complete